MGKEDDNMNTDKEQTFKRNSLSGLWKQNRSAYRQYRFNRSFMSEFDYRNAYMKRLIHAKGFFKIKQPFYCIYGSNITVGRAFTCGHSAYFEDDAVITIKNHVQLGNHVKLLTAKLDYEGNDRQRGVASPITIEDNVCIGNDVTILAGVTIHRGAVIGDGCVIDKDIAAGTAVTCRKELVYSEAKAENLGDDMQNEKSYCERLLDHVNLDKTDKLIRVVIFTGSLYCAYRTIRLADEKKAELKSKRALIERMIPQTERKNKKTCCKEKCK